MTDRWAGHSLLTKSVLLALLERAAGGGAEFSRSERVLHGACEFWAAVSTGHLARYLESDAEDRLRAAEEVCREIGATGVADELQRALAEWPATSGGLSRIAFVARLESALRDTDDPVNQLITEHAVRCAAEATGSGR